LLVAVAHSLVRERPGVPVDARVLLELIEALRSELERLVAEGGSALQDRRVLELSQRLDAALVLLMRQHER